MKRFLFISSLAAAAFQLAFGQLNVAIVTKTPMPSELSVWEQDPTALRLIITNTTGGSYPGARVSFTLTDLEKGKVVASSIDTDPAIPTFDIGPSQTLILFGKSVINLHAVILDPSVKSIATATNRIPEGMYQLCIQILANGRLSGSIGSQCQTFTILIPDPPTLLNPASMSIIKPPMLPTFTWTPVLLANGLQASYSLTIAPIFQSQSAKDAIDKNTPLLSKKVNATSYFYAPSNPAFSFYPAAVGFAWQVQAIDANGNPAARNEGKSEIFTFALGPKGEPPVLLTPAENASVNTKSPKFSWSYTFVPGENTRSRLRVAEMLAGQTPDAAIGNYPTSSQIIYGQVTSYTPSQPLSLSATKKYVWQVQVLDAVTGTVLRSSAVSTFTITPLQLLLPGPNETVAFKRPTFSWSYQGAAGKFYDLRLAAVPMIMTPDFSLENLLKNGPYVFEQKSIDGAKTSGVNSPNLEIPKFTPMVNLTLNPGIHYAWQILARETPNGTILGTSEIRTFIYNPYQAGIPFNTQVSGKLVYKFPGYDNQLWPFGGINIKLVVKYVLKNISAVGGFAQNAQQGGTYVIPVTSTMYAPGFQKQPVDMNKVLAVTKTGGDGNFTFSFVSLDSMKLIQKNYQVSSGGGEFKGSVTGDLYRVARIVVESPASSFFTSPDVDVIVQPGETVAPGFFGLIPAVVRAYSLKVHVTTFENITQATTGSLANMNVYLLRETRPAYVPTNEGAEPKRAPGDSVVTMKMYWGAVCEVIGKTQTGNDGVAHFTRLVKNIAPNDKYLLYAESMPGSFYNYKGWLGDVRFANSSDYAVFNNEYKYQEITKELQCFPLPPRVYGTARRGDSKQPLLFAQVSLVETIILATKETNQFTNIKGQFDFSNLNVIKDASNNVIGPIRLLKIKRYGYRDTTLKVNNLVPMRPGDQYEANVELKPYSSIKGTIVDEYGSGVAASVKLVGGVSKNVTPPPYFILGSFKTPPASFELPSPQGWQTLIIDPTFFNNTLLRDTVKVLVGDEAVKLAAPIVLYRKAHRIRVTVQEATTSKLQIPGFAPKKIAGALVQIQDSYGNAVQGPGGALQQTTNQSGVAEFVFANSGTNFVLAIAGPKDQDYVAKKVPVPYSVASKDWTPVAAVLKKGAAISGTVTVASGQTVPNAHVFLDQSSNEGPVETWSDHNGAFTLHSVPLGANTYKAAKSKSNLIGSQQVLTTTAQGLQGVVFKLKVYADMDIGHLMGFPIEVDSLADQPGSVRISGRFVNMDSLDNNQFQIISSSEQLKFFNVEIVPSTLTTTLFGKQVPIAKPKSSSVKTEENQLPIAVYYSFPAVVQDQNIGVEVTESQTGYGAIKGRVFVGETAFQKDLAFKEGGFFVRGTGSTDLRIPVITASKQDPVTAPKGLAMVNSAGGSVHFSMYEFDATADSSASYLVKDSVKLQTTLHTSLSNVTPSDLAINLGTVAAGKQGFQAMSNVLKSVTLNLDQWTVQADTFSLNGYLQLKGGTLKTSAVDVPVTSMIIGPNTIESADFDLQNMSIGGIIPLTVHTQPLLGYDGAYKRWFLSASGSPAASFSGLPGMESGSKFMIGTFSLYSNDASVALTPYVPQPKIKFYDIGLLTPDLIAYFPTTGIVDIKGLSFAFPKVAVNATIRYMKENNQIKFRLVPFQFSFDSKGVHYSAGYTNAEGATQTLDEHGFRAKGTVSESGKFSLTAWLYHTKDSTAIWVESPSTPYVASAPAWQTMAVSGNATYFDKITGFMKPLGPDDWDYFTFSGDLTGSQATGVVPGKNRLTFVVHGDVVANGQELGVKNVETPFGGMSWTYDFEQGRLWGQLHVSQSVAGQIFLSGDANSVVDGSGWYFLGGMTMSMASPHFDGQAGILFGNYPMTEEIKKTFEDHSWVYQNKHQLPAAFPSSVSGFLFEGSVELPVPVFPDFDFDFGLVSAKLTKTIGADVRFGTNFSTVNSYSAGVDVFAKIEAGIGGTIGVACATVDAKVLADLKFEGQYQSNGSWYLEGEQSITFSGSTTVGFGGCDSECGSIDIGPLSTPCATDTEGASKSIGVLCHYGSDDKYLHVYFK